MLALAQATWSGEDGLPILLGPGLPPPSFPTLISQAQEVLSLGGKFVEVEGAKDEATAGGYAVEQTDGV